MSSPPPKAISVFILLNIIFFTCVSANKPLCPPAKTTPSPVAPPKKGGSAGKCPKDTLKFGICGDWLGLVHEVVGAPPSSHCCSLLKGVADLEAAACLCTAIKANVLGIKDFTVPVAITVLLNSCEKKVPRGYVCA